MITKDEALIFLENDLRHAESCIKRLNADGKNREREISVVQKSVDAYRMAIDALRGQEDQQQPLTMAELRNMNGETVYCLELNLYVTILAKKVGFVHVHYSFPGEYGECKAMGLTLYRTRPEEDV